MKFEQPTSFNIKDKSNNEKAKSDLLEKCKSEIDKIAEEAMGKVKKRREEDIEELHKIREGKDKKKTEDKKETKKTEIPDMEEFIDFYKRR